MAAGGVSEGRGGCGGPMDREGEGRERPRLRIKPAGEGEGMIGGRLN